MTERSWKGPAGSTTREVQLSRYFMWRESLVYSHCSLALSCSNRKIVYIIVQIARSILSSGSVTQKDKEEVCFIFY